jgi:thiol:disulfide interchange protein
MMILVYLFYKLNNMKNLILLTAFLIASSSLINAQESVDILMNRSLTEAIASDKHVLVKFEASWCGWCHRMTKNINNKKVAKFFNENYVVLPIVVFENGDQVSLENPGSRELVTTYKGDRAGLPFWVILDATGMLVTDSFNEKGNNLGCPASQEEVTAFIEKLKATSKMTGKDEKNIAMIFTKK